MIKFYFVSWLAALDKYHCTEESFFQYRSNFFQIPKTNLAGGWLGVCLSYIWLKHLSPCAKCFPGVIQIELVRISTYNWNILRGDRMIKSWDWKELTKTPPTSVQTWVPLWQKFLSCESSILVTWFPVLKPILPWDKPYTQKNEWKQVQRLYNLHRRQYLKMRSLIIMQVCPPTIFYSS